MSPGSSDPVVLKKYGNRRLYDTERSGYVTLAEVEDLLQQGRDVQVVDAKSGDDLTRAVLVQIIAERPASRDVLPLAFLKEAIRKSASPEKGQFQEVLLGWVDAFARAQRGVLDQMQQIAAQAWRPFGPPGGFPPGAGGSGGPAAPSPEEVVARARAGGPSSAERADELEAIRSELAETQAMLRQLLKQQAQAEKAPEQGSRDAPEEPGR